MTQSSVSLLSASRVLVILGGMVMVPWVRNVSQISTKPRSAQRSRYPVRRTVVEFVGVRERPFLVFFWMMAIGSSCKFGPIVTWSDFFFLFLSWFIFHDPIISQGHRTHSSFSKIETAASKSHLFSSHTKPSLESTQVTECLFTLTWST